MKLKQKVIAASFMVFSLIAASGAVIATLDQPLFSNVRANAAPFTMIFNSDNTPFTSSDTSFSQKESTYGSPSKRTVMVYSSAKYLENGHCVLENNSTFFKKDNAPTYSMKSLSASGSGVLKILTCFGPNDFEEHYDPGLGYDITPYEYTLNLTSDESEIGIVGNYFRISAINGDVEIKSLSIEYGCSEEESMFSNVHFTDTDNYIQHRKEFRDNSWYENIADVKLTSSTQLSISDLTIRNSDNVNDYTFDCTKLVDNQDGTYVASFSLTGMNVSTGKWTQHEFEPRIYIGNKRIDGTKNGTIYVANRSIDTSPVRNAADDNIYSSAGGDCAYNFTIKNNAVTISWINNLDYGVTNKGMRFTNIGRNKEGWFPITIDEIYDFNESKNYFNLAGFVSTEEEAIYVKDHLSSYQLYSNNGVMNATPSIDHFSYEPWYYNDGGYKINMWFDVSSGNGNEYAIGLKYNGLPYILRNDSTDLYVGGGVSNSGLLRTQYTINESSGWDTGYRNPGSGVYQYAYHMHGAWNWIWVSSQPLCRYSIWWDEDWIWNDGAVLFAWVYSKDDESDAIWVEAHKYGDSNNSVWMDVDAKYTKFKLARCSSGTTIENVGWDRKWNEANAVDISSHANTYKCSGWH